jgi:hypothetical protein
MGLVPPENVIAIRDDSLQPPVGNKGNYILGTSGIRNYEN